MEEVALELQPNFPMLDGSRKRYTFSFWTFGYRREHPVPSPDFPGPWGVLWVSTGFPKRLPPEVLESILTELVQIISFISVG